jgi:transposase
VRTFEFFGGVPAVLVPDNLKSGVSKVCAYDPQLNPTYRDLAEHYGIAVIPARPRHPKDKAKVEAGVLLVERWILARLRHRTLFGLAELNQAIRELCAALNQRPFKKLPDSRRHWFETLERSALRPLPVVACEALTAADRVLAHDGARLAGE